MAVTITPVLTMNGEAAAWTCRSGPDHQRFGDPYTTSCYIARVPSDKVDISALSGPSLSCAEVKELLRLLRTQGVREVGWDRIRAGGGHHARRRG